MRVNGGSGGRQREPPGAEASGTLYYGMPIGHPAAHPTGLALAALVAFVGLPLGIQGQASPFDAARLMSDVEAYHGFGVHRTAHDGDLATSAWLGERLRAAGLDTQEHRFELRQFFLAGASVEDGEGRIAAFPIWLPRPTSPEGLTARLVRVDSETPDRDIRGSIAWLAGAGPADRRALDDKAIAAGAAAVVFETTDRGGLGLFQAENAERRWVDVQRPVPTLMFGSAEASRLRRAVGSEVTVRLTGRLVEDAQAASVIGRYVVDEDADWIVVSTPSSGWFTNAGERGPGIAMLLALAGWVGERRPSLNYFFVATSGHELDYLGARLLHEAHLAPEPSRTRAWLHLGAQIATPPWHEVDGAFVPTTEVTTGTLQATEGLGPLLARAFADLPMYTLRTDTRIGEFRDLVDHGYRGLGIVGGSNPWFHVPGDDPRGVSAGTLARVTAAMAEALLAVEDMRPLPLSSPR